MIYPSLTSIIAGCFFGVVIAYASYRLKALSVSGAITSAFLGAVIFGLGGLGHTAVLLGFFFSSSILSKLFNDGKRSNNEKYAKGSRRDAWQVLANGGVAGFFVILEAIYPEETVFWLMFCASLAAANADTWATELGAFSNSPPRLITNFKSVEKGTSGGITIIGSLSAFAGAAIIASIASFFGPGTLIIIWITLAGFFGSIVDSWVGASVQGVYLCQNCQKETEKHPIHGCGTGTVLLRGQNWINNDWVNTFCTLSAALVIGIFHFIG